MHIYSAQVCLVATLCQLCAMQDKAVHCTTAGGVVTTGSSYTCPEVITRSSYICTDVTIFWQTAVQVLRNEYLFLIFTRAPYQLATRLVLRYVDTAMSKTHSLPSENLLSSKGKMPTNGEWSCGWVCMGCCEAPEKGHLIRQRNPLEKDL